MKKILAVILSAVMLFCCIPFAASAQDDTAVHFTVNDTFESTGALVSGTDYVIDAGVTMTVPFDITLNVPTNTTLTVERGGRLVVAGTLAILSGGKLEVWGALEGGNTKIQCNAGGEAWTELRFPDLSAANVALKDKIKVSYSYSTTGNAYDDLSHKVISGEVDDAGETIEVPLNQYVYITAEIIEPVKGEDKYDDAEMDVFLNGIRIPYSQGTHHISLSTSADVTYSAWANENDFLNSYNVYLHNKEGYKVVGREGETSSDGETITLKHGQNFAFRIEVEPEYDMSDYEVYIYNGYGWVNPDTDAGSLKDIVPAQPDQYGYYHINNITSEYTVYVAGMMSNETILMIGDILNMIKSFFETISQIFAQLFASLGLSFGDATV